MAEKRFPLRVLELPRRFVLRANPPLPLLRKETYRTRPLVFFLKNLAKNLEYFATRLERWLG